MHITGKSVVALTVAVALGISFNALASETRDSSLDALRHEVVELRQAVAKLAKHIENLERRLHGLERSISQRDYANQLVFPIDVEIGTWIDDFETDQRRIQRQWDGSSIPSIEPRHRFDRNSIPQIEPRR